MAAKVCMLLAHHPFLDSRIFKKEARSLAKAGYRVTVTAPRRNGFLYEVDGTPFTNRFRADRFVHEGITIAAYDDEREPLEQMWANIKSGGHTGFTNALTKIGIAQQADIYHAHEFLSLYAGIGVIRQLRAIGKHARLIYDSHEITPDPLEPKNPAKTALLQQMLDRMLLEADAVITVSEAMKTWYLARNTTLNVETIYNSPPLAPQPAAAQSAAAATPAFTACYEGSITNHKGNIEKIVDITRLCSQQIEFKFKILGGARSGERLAVPQELANRIIQIGWVDYGDIPSHMAEVDIGWLHFNTSQSLNRFFALPNKFFSYLNNGVPVVVNKCMEMERFVRMHRCGLVLQQAHPSANDYAQAFLYLHRHPELLQSMRRNARSAMEKYYCWERMEHTLLNLYKQVLGQKTPFLYR